MSDFNLHKWFKNQYLQENDDPKMGAELEAGMHGTGVAEAQGDLYSAISAAVPENTSYKDFAKAVAKMLIEDYGSHNFKPFMDMLHAELGMGESLNEADNDSFEEEFKAKFNNLRTYFSSDKIEFLERSDISEELFEKMIAFIESKGYKVNRQQSERFYDYEPGERHFYPQIRFSK